MVLYARSFLRIRTESVMQSAERATNAKTEVAAKDPSPVLGIEGVGAGVGVGLGVGDGVGVEVVPSFEYSIAVELTGAGLSASESV